MRKQKACYQSWQQAFSVWAVLHSAGYFPGPQATGAGVDAAGGTVDNRLDALYIRFPGTVRAVMGMGNLDTESDTLLANIAFSHLSAPP